MLSYVQKLEARVNELYGWFNQQNREEYQGEQRAGEHFEYQEYETAIRQARWLLKDVNSKPLSRGQQSSMPTRPYLQHSGGGLQFGMSLSCFQSVIQSHTKLCQQANRSTPTIEGQ